MIRPVPAFMSTAAVALVMAGTVQAGILFPGPGFGGGLGWTGNLTVVPGSTLEVFLADTNPGGATVSAPANVSGTIHATIRNAPFAAAMQMHGAALDLSDVSLSLDLGGSDGTVDAESLGLRLHISGPPIFASTMVGVISTFDLGGTDVAIDDGEFSYEGSGPVGGQVGQGTFDFDANPLSFVLPPGSTIETIEDFISSPVFTSITVEVPLALSHAIATDPIPLDFGIAGTLLLTGRFWWPEPGTWLLLAMGMAGLIPLIRRRLNKQ